MAFMHSKRIMYKPKFLVSLNISLNKYIITVNRQTTALMQFRSLLGFFPDDRTNNNDIRIVNSLWQSQYDICSLKLCLCKASIKTNFLTFFYAQYTTPFVRPFLSFTEVKEPFYGYQRLHINFSFSGVQILLLNIDIVIGEKCLFLTYL